MQTIELSAKVTIKKKTKNDETVTRKKEIESKTFRDTALLVVGQVTKHHRLFADVARSVSESTGLKKKEIQLESETKANRQSEERHTSE
jgi:hypothetical protein